MNTEAFSKHIPLKNIKVTDFFWLSETELVRKEVIPYQYEALHDRIPEADLTGMIIEITYSDGSKEHITDASKLEVKGFDTKLTGLKAVTVEYEVLTVQYYITVSYVWWQWIIMILLLGFLWY